VAVERLSFFLGILCGKNFSPPSGCFFSPIRKVQPPIVKHSGSLSLAFCFPYMAVRISLPSRHKSWTNSYLLPSWFFTWSSDFSLFMGLVLGLGFSFSFQRGTPFFPNFAKSKRFDIDHSWSPDHSRVDFFKPPQDCLSFGFFQDRSVTLPTAGDPLLFHKV